MEMELNLLLFLLSFSLLHCCSSSTFPNDTATLLQFRLDSDPHGNLLSNWSSSNACTSKWFGVNCSSNGRVFSLSLPSLNLRGPISSLSSLDQLRVLDLSNNRLNGSVSPLSNCTNLKLVYLSRNDFSGEIPPEFGSLDRLLRLDISDNNLAGHLPVELKKLTRLLTFRVQNNAISGKIPDFSETLNQLKELNLSNNELFGKVPNGLLKIFGEKSFLGNEQLCGSSPLPACSFNGDNVEASSASAATAQTVPSNPISFPPLKPRKGSNHGIVIPLIVANCVLVVIVLSFVLAFCCKRCSSPRDDEIEERENGKRRSSYGSEKRVYASNGSVNGGGFDSDETNGTDKSRLVFFDRKKQFELEDLLRASAEMLGKGSLGTVYRAVLDDVATVAVKRLKDANPCARKEFEQYMDVIGRLKHPNIVRLRAYYYAREEKLLVYDYLSNGSLHSLLHGNRGPGRIPLDWTTRISLVLGAARGLARIHAEYSSSKIPHGNVKSSNVLLDKNGVACISDFGLSLLLNPTHAIARLGGYKAPEQSETKRLSQQADVYSFGVLLLEVLTAKTPSQFPSPTRPKNIDSEDEESLDLPKWVRSVVRDEWTAEVFDPELLRYKNIEEELVSMLHVAMACVVPQPEKRPSMMEVAKMIEEIRVEQSPLCEDYNESRNSLSPSLPTTEEAVGVY
ncbi:leucine-rich repeat receptor-like protein kinase PXC1 [Amaranthus tricolor]|uniref:leucine-rich repeat receptor-like protein kinase PXC1 n=1 Tax=Amaranthus tricolor TaxID=29722 RepID=UPI00258389ED|nr:leucine-rich repeat receptor-like protein kinase PXC1 [Amaranthus tricolor]